MKPLCLGFVLDPAEKAATTLLGAFVVKFSLVFSLANLLMFYGKQAASALGRPRAGIPVVVDHATEHIHRYVGPWIISRCGIDVRSAWRYSWGDGRMGSR